MSMQQAPPGKMSVIGREYPHKPHIYTQYLVNPYIIDHELLIAC